jgi:hypothetical protein
MIIQIPKSHDEVRVGFTVGVWRELELALESQRRPLECEPIVLLAHQVGKERLPEVPESLLLRERRLDAKGKPRNGRVADRQSQTKRLFPTQTLVRAIEKRRLDLPQEEQRRPLIDP